MQSGGLDRAYDLARSIQTKATGQLHGTWKHEMYVQVSKLLWCTQGFDYFGLSLLDE